MTFITVPEGYEKTSLSDLQGAWGCLRDAVVDNGDIVNLIPKYVPHFKPGKELRKRVNNSTNK